MDRRFEAQRERTGDGMHQETEYIALTNDLLFHMVFTKNAEALKSLLSTLLSIPEGSIQRVEILNPMQYSDMIASRLTVLDLKVHLNDERYVIVEMQVRRFEYWTNRTLAYACRQVADQVQGEFDYEKLEQVVQISIMDHTLFGDHRRFFAKYELRDGEGYRYSDRLCFLVMDLTAADEATEEERSKGLVEWADAFKAKSWNEVQRIENRGVKEAAKTMQMIMANPTERDLIRARLDAEIDHRTIINAERRQGEKNAYIESARRMKADGMPPELISKYTGLSIKELLSL